MNALPIQGRGAFFDSNAGFSPLMSPLGGGRNVIDPLGMGMELVPMRGLPFDPRRGGGLPGALMPMGGRLPLARGPLPGPLIGRPGMTRDPLLRQALQPRPFPRALDFPPAFDPRLGGLPPSLVPYAPFPGGWWPHGSSCDNCYRGRSFHVNQGHYGHDCGCHGSCDRPFSSRGEPSKVKDVTIRGKARRVRASYLTEAGKFEADIVKYMEKKKQEEIPDKVVDMLVSFINEERYMNRSLVHEVTLNILASNVGAKSAVEYSLKRLKQSMLNDWEVCAYDLCYVCTLITQSGKVDDGLREWLKKSWKGEEEIWWELTQTPSWRDLRDERPEVVAELQRMMGTRPEPRDGIYPL